MLEADKQLLTDFLFRRISRADLLKKYSRDLEKDDNYIYDSFFGATETKNNDELELSLLMLLFNVRVTLEPRFIDLLCRLLGEEWHHKHEDIVFILQGIKSPQTVDALYSAIFKRLAYLQYDTTYSLARNIMHALSDIGSPMAKKKLLDLSHCGITILEEKAKELLDLN
jgi:hypothetical protein